jgi:hypothetical protein
MKITDLRRAYHRRLCEEIIRFKRDKATNYPNFADKGSNSSRDIALGVVQRLGCEPSYESMSGQAVGRLFEAITKDFLEKAFGQLHHLRPGRWYYSVETPIADFDQYEHLAELERIVGQIDTLSSSLGGVTISSNQISSLAGGRFLMQRLTKKNR